MPFPRIKLSYFNIEGRAEKVRLALILQGINFEDDRISFNDWPKIKPTTKFGQVPIMFIDDREPISQSNAMLHYVGRLGKIFGNYYGDG